MSKAPDVRAFRVAARRILRQDVSALLPSTLKIRNTVRQKNWLDYIKTLMESEVHAKGAARGPRGSV